MAETQRFERLRGLLPRRLGLLDIGARGGAKWPWDQMPGDMLRQTLVEPDPEEAKRLQAAAGSPEARAVLPLALWREKTSLKLNVTRSPGASSVYPANLALLSRFPDARRFETVAAVDVRGTTIDDAASSGHLTDIDVAKIDVQGAELAILEGGTRFLQRELVCLEVEVEFCELYQGQPLFAQVDSHVRRLGLEFWDLQLHHWRYERGITADGPRKGQGIYGDALYMRPLHGLADWLGTLPPEAARAKAAASVVCALAYGFPDYSRALICERSVCDALGPSLLDDLDRVLKEGSRPLGTSWLANKSLNRIFGFLERVSRPPHASWEWSGPEIGSRWWRGRWI
jgi:FkbM family methyltransferase